MFKRTDQEIQDRFYKLESRADVADLLEIEDKSLRYFLYVKRPENLYFTFNVPKKNGKPRTINAPKNELKNIQKKLAYILNLVYKVKASAHGFVNGKNILTNATNHSNRKVILNIDLKDFFTQIHFGRVRGMLSKKPYNIGIEAATVISQLACYNGVLPQGAPSSPIITNMICSPLDTQFTKIAFKNNAKYTRYADDITFSTYDKQFCKDIVNNDVYNLQLGKDITKTLKDNGFTVNDDKIFLNTRNTRQEVTGLVVNKFPNLKREYLKNLRAILHNCERDGVYNTAKVYIKKGFCRNKEIQKTAMDEKHKDEVISWFKLVIRGKINFIKQIRGNDDLIFLKYAEKANIIFKEEIFNVTKLKNFNDNIVNNVLVIRNNNNTKQGSGFLLKDFGLVTCFHVTEDGNYYQVYKLDQNNDTTHICTIAKDLNEIKSDKNIDYAIYKFKDGNDSFLELGDSTSLGIGDEVTIIGYPNFLEGNSPYIQKCFITSNKFYMGAKFFTVSANIAHGASGGVVLNNQNKVVGIIKGAPASLDECEDDENRGFVPIDIVLSHYNK